MLRLSVLLLSVFLSACQSANPYKASSLPIPPAPPGAAHQPVPASSYPAAPLNYSRYKHWSWAGAQPDALLQDAVSEALDQRGLRPARAGTSADLTVSAVLDTEVLSQSTYDYYDTDHYNRGYYDGGYYGYGSGRYGSAYYPIPRTYDISVKVLRITLFDTKNNQTVWSGSAEYEDSGKASRGALQKAARQALDGMPSA